MEEQSTVQFIKVHYGPSKPGVQTGEARVSLGSREASWQFGGY